MIVQSQKRHLMWCSFFLTAKDKITLSYLNFCYELVQMESVFVLLVLYSDVNRCHCDSVHPNIDTAYKASSLKRHRFHWNNVGTWECTCMYQYRYFFPEHNSDLRIDLTHITIRIMKCRLNLICIMYCITS